MIHAPNMLMIGSTGRNSGKTVLGCEIIHRTDRTDRSDPSDRSHQVYAAKVTAVQERDGLCPRGGEGCGVCSSLDGPFCITEETTPGTEKDTQRLLAAGAECVYWLRVLKEHLEEGARALLGLIPPDALVVCESNSLRKVVEPQLFIMCRDKDSSAVKSSARDVENHADVMLTSDGQAFDLDTSRIRVANGQWSFRYPASAVILAGGASSRMGRDKALLPVDGLPLIAHLCRQLRPHFEDILVSTNHPEKFSFLDHVIFVPDREPGKGPLMGIVSALEATAHDLNFVVPCDTPVIDVRALRCLMRAMGGRDAAVPIVNGIQVQPLFAVYRKSALAVLGAFVNEGNYSVKKAAAKCKVKYVSLERAPLESFNTFKEYEDLIAAREKGRTPEYTK